MEITTTEAIPIFLWIGIGTGSTIVWTESYSAGITFLKLSISPLKFPERLRWLSHAAFFV